MTASLSEAFQNKSKKENDKLRTVVSRSLGLDMLNLLNEGTHSDFTLTTLNGPIALHSAVLHIRCPLFYNECLKNSHGVLNEMPEATLRRIIKAIYSEDSLEFVEEDIRRAKEERSRARQAVKIVTSSHDEEESIDNLAADSGALHLTTAPFESESEFTNVTPLEEVAITPLDDVKSIPVLTDTSDHSSSDSEDAGSPLYDIPKITRQVTQIERVDEACSVLGRNLLQLFSSEELSDVILTVNGLAVKAHKCVLSARSAYFAMMLSGNWNETDKSKIELHGVSPVALHQTLQFIYGGVMHIPEDCNIVDLTHIASMYEINDFMKVVCNAIQQDYCHFFHRPCKGCLDGIASTLNLSMMYNLDDLLQRCLAWSNKHYERLWSCKTFATLPIEVLDKCLLNLLESINNLNVLGIFLTCDKLQGTLPKVKWVETVELMVTNVREACIVHVGANLDKILNPIQVEQLQKSMTLGLSTLGELMTQAIMRMSVESACQNYVAMHNLKLCSEKETCDWSEDFKDLVRTLFKKCEDYMGLYLHQIVGTDGWSLIDPDIQSKIKEGAYYVTLEDTKKTKPIPARLLATASSQRNRGSSNQNSKTIVLSGSKLGRGEGARPKTINPSTTVRASRVDKKIPRKLSDRKTLKSKGPSQDNTKDEKINTQEPSSVKSTNSTILDGRDTNPVTKGEETSTGASSIPTSGHKGQAQVNEFFWLDEVRPSQVTCVFQEDNMSVTSEDALSVCSHQAMIGSTIALSDFGGDETDLAANPSFYDRSPGSPDLNSDMNHLPVSGSTSDFLSPMMNSKSQYTPKEAKAEHSVAKTGKHNKHIEGILDRHIMMKGNKTVEANRTKARIMRSINDNEDDGMSVCSTRACHGSISEDRGWEDLSDQGSMGAEQGNDDNVFGGCSRSSSQTTESKSSMNLIPNMPLLFYDSLDTYLEFDFIKPED